MGDVKCNDSNLTLPMISSIRWMQRRVSSMVPIIFNLTGNVTGMDSVKYEFRDVKVR